jgi:beta-lactamase class A
MRRIAFVGGLAAAALPLRGGATPSLDAVASEAAASSSGVVGAAVRALGDCRPALAYHADVVFPAASTIKSLILATLYAEADADPSLLTRKVPIRDADRVGGSDVLATAPPGAQFTGAQLAHAMIVQSDNTAGNALITLLGFEAINQKATELGLTHTQCKRHFMDFPAIWRHSDNLTTPRDMAMLFYEIEKGARGNGSDVASQKACRAMVGILLQQEDREKIAAGLPPGTPLANKTGEIAGVRSDVGIVDPYGATPYVLAVLTKNLADAHAGVLAIRKIARAVNAAVAVC